MNDKRVLKINPDLFAISNNNTTRKRQRNAATEGGIRMKDPYREQKKKEETLKNRTALLRMLRRNQEERYKDLMEHNNRPNPKTQQVEQSGNGHKDFQEAKIFMDNLANKTENDLKINQQLRINNTHYSQPHIHSQSIQPHIINPHNQHNQPIEYVTDIYQHEPSLKFRSPQQTTLQSHTSPNISSYYGGGSQPHQPNQQQSSTEPILTKNTTQIMEDKINESLKRITEIRQTAEKMEEFKEKMRPKIKKQKKTRKRTYNIGKSKTIPRVSVLISNKTIRHNVSSKTQMLKQVPIQDIKKYLMKRGLIKVGSIAPNDVLRKIYESSILICGEVQNHNPENLLYNFLYE